MLNKMAKTKKQKSRLDKLDRWLYKSSLIYRLLRKLFQSVYGKLIFTLIILSAISCFTFYKLSINEINRTMILWKDCVNSKNYSKLEAISDYSQNNPYRISLPDQIFIETGDFFINSIELKEIDFDLFLKALQTF